MRSVLFKDANRKYACVSSLLLSLGPVLAVSSSQRDGKSCAATLTVDRKDQKKFHIPPKFEELPDAGDAVWQREAFHSSRNRQR